MALAPVSGKWGVALPNAKRDRPMPSVVIVGAGVIGTLSAYELARAGWQVTLLDRKTVGQECSRGNCGYVCPSHVLPLAVPGALWGTMKTLFSRNSPLKVRPGFALANLGWFLNFAKKCNKTDMLAAAVGIQDMLVSSRKLYDELLEREAFHVEWDTHGLMFVFHTAKAFEHYHEADELLTKQFNTPCTRYDRDELAKLEPTLKPGAASGGYLYRTDAQLRPEVLMKQLQRKLIDMGVTVVENSEVTGFIGQKTGSILGVNTTKGDILASHTLITTGATAPLLAKQFGVKLPIIPGKGYSITMPKPTPSPTYPMIFEEHRVAVSPFESGLRIGSTMEFAGYDESMNRNRLKLLTDAAEFYLTNPGDPTQATDEWWGWRPMVFDGKPIIDRLPKHSNVWIAAGHGMLGLSMATSTARLVKELLNDEAPHIPAEAYRLGRF
jgi:D-amino-acid dehydrogenase